MEKTINIAYLTQYNITTDKVHHAFIWREIGTNNNYREYFVAELDDFEKIHRKFDNFVIYIASAEGENVYNGSCSLYYCNAELIKL